MQLVDREHDMTDLRDGGNRSTNLLGKDPTGSTATASITTTTGLGGRKGQLADKMNTTAKASNNSRQQTQKGRQQQ
jgi:ABC-type transporter Mla subunit MlaD